MELPKDYVFYPLQTVVDTVAIFARITQTDAIWHLAEQSAKHGVALVLTFDRMGYSGFSELAQHPENFTNTIAQFPLKRAVEVVYNCKKMLIKKNLSKYHQPDISNMELPKDYVFYPLQTVVDTVAIFARITQTDAIWHLAEQSAKHGVALVLTFDRMGYSGFSELAQHPENFTNTIAQFPLKRAVEVVYNCKKMLIKKNLSKYHQPDISNMELPKDYVFYPLQTVIDTVAIFARITQTDAIWHLAEQSAKHVVALVLTFDRMGYSGFSELAQHPENFTNTIAQFPLKRAVEVVYNCKKMLIKKNLSKYHQPDISNMELPKDYVFYPLQTVVDTVAIFARITQTDAIWHLAEQSAKHGVALVLTFDRMGYSGFSELAQHPENFTNTIAQFPLKRAVEVVYNCKKMLIKKTCQSITSPIFQIWNCRRIMFFILCKRLLIPSRFLPE